MSGTFRSLRIRNYRIWAAGALVSNIGTWMQRIGQDWLVLTALTHHSAAAVGVVMALQFGPQLALLPLTGYAADHVDRRTLMYGTQATMGLLALGLGVMTIGGWIRLWEVDLFALGLGCAAAFDAPCRQTFVANLVGEDDLSNAVALNSTSFNAARMLGPAAAGWVIAAFGNGWVFLVNALSFGGVLLSLTLIRPQELHGDHRARKRSGLADGFRYVRQRRDLQAILLMLFLIGTFGLNFPIFISTMAVTVFHAGAGHYGMLTSAMAVGTITGALLSARRARPHFALLVTAAAGFGASVAVAAWMPSYALFGLVLVPVGIAALTFTNSSNALMQLSSEPALRGRVIAIYMAVVMGGTPIGAPIVGWLADTYGPRWAMTSAAIAGLLAAAVGIAYRIKQPPTDR